MARILIGNFKGPKGDTGPQGPQGIQGPQGPQGESGEINGESIIEYVENTDANPPASPGVIKNILGWLIGKMKAVIAQNNDLSQELAGKANTIHTHSTTQITDFTEQLNNWGAQANVRSASTAISANSAGSVPWSGVSGKPSSFTPSGHTHDDRYYTESEVNNLLNQKITMQKTNYYTLGTKSGITCHVWAIYPTVTVELDGGITQSIAAWNSMTVGTLPSSIRPPMDLIFPIANQAGGYYGLTIFIGTNGQVQVANRSNQNFEISGAEIFTVCTYCCAT